MDIQKIHQYKFTFDSIAKEIKDDEGNTVAVWYARELQQVLGYARWENFVVAVGCAMEACKTLGINVDDHFREVTKMMALAKGAQREVQDFMLTRSACYLIAQNGDPKKEKNVTENVTDVTDNMRPPKTFPPWESWIPTVGTQHSHCGNVFAPPAPVAVEIPFCLLLRFFIRCFEVFHSVFLRCLNWFMPRWRWTGEKN